MIQFRIFYFKINFNEFQAEKNRENHHFFGAYNRIFYDILRILVSGY
jgi:hypothetical protein